MIELGCVPWEEEYTLTDNKVEAEIFLRQLLRAWPQAQGILEVIGQQMPAGLVYDVVLTSDKLEDLELALDIERNLPGHWDKESKDELSRLCGHGRDSDELR